MQYGLGEPRSGSLPEETKQEASLKLIRIGSQGSRCSIDAAPDARHGVPDQDTQTGGPGSVTIDRDVPF